MTPEEITKLAEEYANGTVSLRHTTAIVADEAEDVIYWLLRTHCIVSKDKAAELCRLTLEHGSSIDYGLIDGLTDILCDIFREQHHAEAEKADFAPDMNRFYQASDLDFNVEKAEEVTIDGWVARDEDGKAYLHSIRPERGFEDDRNVGVWGNCIGHQMIVFKRIFPSLTWESDPLEVTITIKPKKR